MKDSQHGIVHGFKILNWQTIVIYGVSLLIDDRVGNSGHRHVATRVSVRPGPC